MRLSAAWSWWGNAGVWALGLLCVAGCGSAPSNVQQTTQPLVAVHTQLLPPGQVAAIQVCNAKPPPQLAVTYGKLPAGLTLGTDGYVRGTPVNPGEFEHIIITATGDHGVVLGSQSYTFAVGGGNSTLADNQMPTRHGDELTFDGMTWGRALVSAYTWDPQLGLLWPLRTGGALAGQTLAPAGASLQLVVGAQAGQGQFELPMSSFDQRISNLAQLTWDGDMDLDLVLLPDSSLQLPTVAAGTQISDSANDWEIQHQISSSTSPGPEVISFADTAPVGRYALVALKVSGNDAITHGWLEMRSRSGEVIAEQAIDAELSDSAQGPLSGELGSGRQSYRALGVVTVATGGAVTYTPPAESGDLFGSSGGAQ